MENVDQQIAAIKQHMPAVYAAIKSKAEAVGNDAYALVRRGLRGEANCFYAFERGRVVGTPFTVAGVMPMVAATMVEWGCAHVCIWPAGDVGGTGVANAAR